MNITSTRPEVPYDTAAGETRNHTGWGSLTRPTGNRMLTGVAAGFADYLGLDVTIVRIVFAVLAVVGGAGVPIYLAAWLLIPEEGAEQSLAMEFLSSHRIRSL